MAYRIEPAICMLVKVEKDVCQVLSKRLEEYSSSVIVVSWSSYWTCFSLVSVRSGCRPVSVIDFVMRRRREDKEYLRCGLAFPLISATGRVMKLVYHW